MSFTQLASSDFVISSDSVTAPAWSTNAPTLSNITSSGIGFYTASSTVSPGTNSYYLDVYQTNYTSSAAAVQFSIAYGNISGSGAAPLNSLVPQNTPSRITFGQYRNLIYGDSTANVNFGTGNTASLDLIAIPIDRNRYKGTKLEDEASAVSLEEANKLYDLAFEILNKNGFAANEGKNTFSKVENDVGTDPASN